MDRRQAIVAVSGVAGVWPAFCAPKPASSALLPTNQTIEQIVSGGPTGLLAVSAKGQLLSLAPESGNSRVLADDVDPQTPLAVGHGRIAARLRNGALWVLDAGHSSGTVGTSAAQALAVSAGLLMLPMAVIGVEDAGHQHRAVRLERGASGAWRVVARSDVAVLPDARPVQADLDGSGDAGHVVLLAGPDAERYRHGVLGDAIEATRVVLLERHDLRVLRDLTIGAPHVLEDIAPRKVRLNAHHGSREGLLSVLSGPEGGQLVLIDADPSSTGALRLAARGRAIGTANRWMSPTTNGDRWLSVHTPHIGGVLHEYQLRGERLEATRHEGGVSNHAIGSRALDLSIWHGDQLLIPDQTRQSWLQLDGRSGWQAVHRWSLASRAKASAKLGHGGAAAVLLEDGRVAVLHFVAGRS